MKTLLRFSLFLMFLLPQVTFGQDLHTRQAPLPCVDKTFTIVAHIVRDSMGEANIMESEIMTALEGLNTAFEPICMGFEICEFRYIDNFQYDYINRFGDSPEESIDDRNDWEEMQAKFNVDRRINMYFVSAFNHELQICGFATLNGITNMESGGIVIQKDCALLPESKTMPHEMGHYFGLYHTFEGSGNELVNGGNCEMAGDSICDTAADPFVITDPVSNYISTDPETPCRFINLRQDAESVYYAPHVGNIMSYYPDACRCGFTYEQYLKMANTFLNAEDKMW